MRLKSIVKKQDLPILGSGLNGDLQIPDAAASSTPTPIKSCEFVPDAYEAILEAEKEGLISILRYEDSSKAKVEWIERKIWEEYENAADKPEYRHFIEGKFPFVR